MKNINDYMSSGYLELWNDNVQARIDNDIEKNRKADASIALENIAPGTDVKVEQISHSFIFGAHMFNFDQLGTDERNEKYKALYGTLFNSATIPFYWKKFEPEEGKPRFEAEFCDTAEFWNTVADPKAQPHWRRPATDPLVDFCERKGIRAHGHPLMWGNRKWQYPEWLLKKLPPELFDEAMKDSGGHSFFTKVLNEFTPAQIAGILKDYTLELHTSMAKRIFEIALRYKDRIQSWDVVNESATDYENGLLDVEAPVCKSDYGLMPGDYTYRGFKLADSIFPKNVKLNINDYNLSDAYVNQTADLLARGCKIDIIGAQTHLFNPQDCLDMADGKTRYKEPDVLWAEMDRLSQLNLPIHLSELTITSPNNDERGFAIQIALMRNMYRLWFSVKNMMGITWWNVVDDCAASGEPSVSGLFFRDMQPKPSYHALNHLIHTEWKTNLTVKAGADGKVNFRGFRGAYRLTWPDSSGSPQTAPFVLS